MQEKFEKYIILILAVVSVFALFATFNYHGDFLIDIGREIFYPKEILVGKVLYKDLFCIYMPFSYFFNTFLYKIFAINFLTLKISASVVSFCIILMIYFISREFFRPLLSFAISFFTICVGILSLNIINYPYPYSFAMIYGLLAFLLSVFSLIKYEKCNKPFWMYLSAFFCGIAVSNKYEFVLYLFVLLYFMLKFRFKHPIKIIFAIGFVPILLFLILFYQGLTISELSNAFLSVTSLSKCETLKYFYMHQGVFLSVNLLPIWFMGTLKCITSLCLIYFSKKVYDKNKFLGFVAFLFAITISWFLIDYTCFIFFAVILLLSFFIFYKNFNYAQKVLILSTLIFSLKSLWAVNLGSYGIYYVPLILVSLLSIYCKKNWQTYFAIVLFSFGIIIGIKNISVTQFKQGIVKTPFGIIRTDVQTAEATNQLIDYINTKTTDKDSILILPEGQMINFATNRKTDGMYNSLIPLYVEFFGEDEIVNRIEKNDYIIFSNKDMSNYYYKTICNDYAVSICNSISEKYNLERTIDSGFRYLIFKRKDLK